ncbi:MAG: LysR substrate-binding domain-containing protein, partial [Pseudomonadota bacterium]
RRLGRPAPAVIEATSIELIKRLTLRGFGISFQTRLGLEEECAAERLVHVPLADKEIGPSELGVYVRAGRAQSTAGAVLLEILIDAVTARAQRDAEA